MVVGQNYFLWKKYCVSLEMIVNMAAIYGEYVVTIKTKKNKKKKKKKRKRKRRRKKKKRKKKRKKEK